LEWQLIRRSAARKKRTFHLFLDADISLAYYFIIKRGGNEALQTCFVQEGAKLAITGTVVDKGQQPADEAPRLRDSVSVGKNKSYDMHGFIREIVVWYNLHSRTYEMEGGNSNVRSRRQDCRH
jgi:hypothetical protein